MLGARRTFRPDPITLCDESIVNTCLLHGERVKHFRLVSWDKVGLASSYSSLAISAGRTGNDGPAAFCWPIRGIIRTPAIVIGSWDAERRFHIAMKSVVRNWTDVREPPASHYSQNGVSGPQCRKCRTGCCRTRGGWLEKPLDNRARGCGERDHPVCRALISPRPESYRHVVYGRTLGINIVGGWG